MKKVLFVCSRNRLRSPTAEQVFAARDDLEVASAGTNRDAETPLSTELIKWADLIVVMEKIHRTKVQRDYRKALDGKRVICLDIPDNYALMDPALVELLQARMSRHLPLHPAGPLHTSFSRSGADDRREPSGSRPAD
jgi:predicted protein tyrosine phosphatase